MKNIVVNFESKTIELTKTFSKRAGVVGTPEYHTLVEVKRAYPDYAIHVKNASTHYTPSLYSRLTYADMEEYIKRNVDENQREEKLLELKYQKAILGFARTKALFIKEFMPCEETETTGTVA